MHGRASLPLTTAFARLALSIFLAQWLKHRERGHPHAEKGSLLLTAVERRVALGSRGPFDYSDATLELFRSHTQTERGSERAMSPHGQNVRCISPRRFLPILFNSELSTAARTAPLFLWLFLLFLLVSLVTLPKYEARSPGQSPLSSLGLGRRQPHTELDLNHTYIYIYFFFFHRFAGNSARLAWVSRNSSATRS